MRGAPLPPGSRELEWLGIVEYAGAGHNQRPSRSTTSLRLPRPPRPSVDGPLADSRWSPRSSGAIGQPLCVYATSTSGGSYADVPAPTGYLMPDAGAAFGYGGLGVSGTGGTSDGVGFGTIGGFGGDAGSPKGLGSGKAPSPKP